uniref:Uncharacterized protein n=1 Tax=Helicotheca tamesis TaxID=374047 RepID=A0A7S2I7Q2_9STRA|mmetsp:Transcript_6633/g.8954  ORF Transcript_6633/g.8954 Transcript_6633/m.8954 type:complete len:131 (+) Transcript_6633:2-394(+)
MSCTKGYGSNVSDPEDYGSDHSQAALIVPRDSTVLNETVTSLLESGQIELPLLKKHICGGLTRGGVIGEASVEGFGSDQVVVEKPSWGLAQLKRKEYDEISKSLADQRVRRLMQNVEFEASQFAKIRLGS